MFIIRNVSKVILVVLMISLLGCALGYAQSRQRPVKNPTEENQHDLLMPVMSRGRINSKKDLGRAGVRSRTAGVNTAVVNVLRQEAGGTVSFNLFGNARFVGVIESFEMPSKDSKAWSGSIQNIDGTFTLVNHKGLIFADIRVQRKGDFDIRPSATTGLYIIRQFDPRKLKQCGNRNNERIKLPVRPDDARFRADDGSVIDVLTLYTSDARAAAGGKAQIEGLIDLCVIETNQAYAKSRINTRIHLVYKDEIQYPESSDMHTDLARLTNGSGVLNHAHELRDNYRADMVDLITEHGQYGGLANEMGTLSHAFESMAFGIVDRESASGNYAYGHEFGHNQGAGHAPDDLGAGGLYSYSCGWRFTVNGIYYHTMMAYRPGQRSLYFSSPEPIASGVPTGTQSCDNVRVLNETALTVANFRNSTP